MTYQEINQNKSLQNLPNEVFKDIPGYERLYQVSNLGRVKALPKWIGTHFTKNEKILYLYKSNYLICNLYKNGKSKRYRVHILILTTFKGKCPESYQGNHKNGIKYNNKLCNLEYCTAKENINHAIKIGKRNHIKYKRGYKGNCTNKIKIKQYNLNNNFIQEYESMYQAEKITGFSRSDISRCAKKIKYYNTVGGFIWRFSNV